MPALRPPRRTGRSAKLPQMLTWRGHIFHLSEAGGCARRKAYESKTYPYPHCSSIHPCFLPPPPWPRPLGRWTRSPLGWRPWWPRLRRRTQWSGLRRRPWRPWRSRWRRLPPLSPLPSAPLQPLLPSPLQERFFLPCGRAARLTAAHPLCRISTALPTFPPPCLPPCSRSTISA